VCPCEYFEETNVGDPESPAKMMMMRSLLKL